MASILTNRSSASLHAAPLVIHQERCNRVDDYYDGLVDDDAAGADSDADPVANACDNRRFVPNPNQADLDSDRHGDVCDNCYTIFLTTSPSSGSRKRGSNRSKSTAAISRRSD